jgi:hypothetical protein
MTVAFDFNTARPTKIAGKPLVDPGRSPQQGPRNAQGLRTDGPTLQEWTAAGYPAKAYPPTGYARRDD